MMKAVTVYEIFCDGCEAEIYPPRAQDYWSDLTEAELAHGFGDWTYTPERQLCWRCTEASAPGGTVDR